MEKQKNRMTPNGREAKDSADEARRKKQRA
jgi:hypothetical protein